MKYIVQEENTLLNYLNSQLPKKEAKNALTKKMVYVNGQLQTHYLYALHAGDEVNIEKRNTSNTSLEILYEDHEIIVINKPSGMLSMGTEKEKNKTAYHLIREYLIRQNKNNKVFIVHRLDQDTSGVLMFAKNETIKNQFQEKWNDLVSVRGYLAIIEGTMEKDHGTIKTYLQESKTKQVYVSQKEGKIAITHYHTLKSNHKYSLLEINLDTGRKNQIRVHLSYYHHPIVGDRKYGSTNNSILRLALHSHILEVEHPVTHIRLHFEAKMPEIFKQLI